MKIKNGFQYNLILTNINIPAFTSSIRYPNSYQHVLQTKLLDLIETNINYIEILKSEKPDDYKIIIGMELNTIHNLGLSNSAIKQFFNFLKDNGLVNDDKTLKPEALKFKFSYERTGSGFETGYIFEALETPKTKTGKK